MDIFDQVEECGYVVSEDKTELHKVLYINRELDFIVTDKREILRLGDGYFWVHRNAFGRNESACYFYPHKQKQKYYQWVLVDEEGKCLITHSQNEDGEKSIDNNPGYFTKENPPSCEGFFENRKCKWIPILETEKEA